MGLTDNYDLFIFDWDGTLTSMKLVNRLNEMFNPFWIRRKKLSLMAASEKRRMIKAQELAEQRETNEYGGMVDVLMMFYRQRLQEGSADVLKELKHRRKKVALFSNGAYWRVSREAKRLDVSRYFDLVLSASSINAVKPNPLGIHLIMKREKIPRGRTLYIGDMVDDIMAARLGRVDCCAIADGFDNIYALKEEKPRYVYTDMRDFYRHL